MFCNTSSEIIISCFRCDRHDRQSRASMRVRECPVPTCMGLLAGSASRLLEESAWFWSHSAGKAAGKFSYRDTAIACTNSYRYGLSPTKIPPHPKTVVTIPLKLIKQYDLASDPTSISSEVIPRTMLTYDTNRRS